MTVLQWWRSGPARVRLRRKLLVFSAPLTLFLVIASLKLFSVMVAGGSATNAYAERDNGGLRDAVETLAVLNVVEPAKAPFAAGGLAVLDNRLEDADRQFSESLARAERSEACVARVNLELVRETLGDRAASTFDNRNAVARYLGARTIVEQAEPGCFAGNTDSDLLRRALRQDSLSRLDRKIAAAQVAPPPPPPPAAAASSPPPAQPGSPAETDAPLRLGPGTPLEQLQQILRDAAARDAQ